MKISFFASQISAGRDGTVGFGTGSNRRQGVKLASSVFAAVAAFLSSNAMAQVVQPGQWEMVSTATSVDMPGAPPQIAQMMKGRPTRISWCITPEEAKLGPRSLTKENKNCRYTRFDVRGNHIDMQMICNQPRGGTMTVTSSGSFTPVSFVSNGRSVVTGRQRMTITSHAEGRRVGECKH